MTEHVPQRTRHDRFLALRPFDKTERFVDGVWWPQSLDLVAELPVLVSAVEAAGYPAVRRLSFAIAGWDAPVVRRTTILDRTVRLGGFNSQDTAELALIDSSGWKRGILLVLPPGTDQATVDRAMAELDGIGDHRSARELLDHAGADPVAAHVDGLLL
ncbi:MAG: DUF5994 family protein [Jatrophihabitans sp.]|uniref:DUF5994 family protein n=1 Tax=Jatrophihabitans sp. TaxID=1932789 RepID=UPI003F81C4E3